MAIRIDVNAFYVKAPDTLFFVAIKKTARSRAVYEGACA